MPKLLKVFLVFVLLILLNPTVALADTTGFLTLINGYRQSKNLSTLAEDQSLTDSACWFAADMGSKNYFPADHVDSLGRTMGQRLAAFGITSGSRAENIFYTTEGSSASFALTAWQNSSGHNANMLGPYSRIGIGRANFNGKWYWVTDFADGTTVSLNNQCGITLTPPPPPKVTPPPASKVIIPTKNTPPPNSTNPPPPALTPTRNVEAVATSSALKIASLSSSFSATRSATLGAVLNNEFDTLTKKNLVLGIFLLTNGPLLGTTSLWIVKPNFFEKILKKLFLR